MQGMRGIHGAGDTRDVVDGDAGIERGREGSGVPGDTVDATSAQDTGDLEDIGTGGAGRDPEDAGARDGCRVG